MTFTRQDVVDVARAALDPVTPWRHQGRLPGIGLDCVGQIIVTGWGLGLWPNDDYQSYRRTPAIGEMQALCNRYLVRLKGRNDYHLGSVVLVNYGGMPCHLAIIGDKFKPWSMIHAFWRNRKVDETRFHETVQSGVVATFDFPGVIDGC